jgi:YVTN family beta-propeller protein
MGTPARSVVALSLLAACASPSAPRPTAAPSSVVPSAASPSAASSSAGPSDAVAVRLRVTTGKRPCGVLGTPGAVWVSNYDSGDLVRLDPRTGAVNVRVDVGDQPCGLAYGAGSVWVENFGSDDVTRVDAATGAVQATIKVGDAPYDVTFGLGAAWVSDHGANTVSRIDPATNRVTKIHVVGTPAGLVVVANALWVAEDFDGRLLRVDPGTGRVTRSFAAGVGAAWLAADARYVWVAAAGAKLVTLFDATTHAFGLRNFAVPAAPFDGDVLAGSAYVPLADGRLVRIDPGTGKVRTVRLPIAAGFVVAAADGAIWAADFGGTDVVRVDPAVFR